MKFIRYICLLISCVIYSQSEEIRHEVYFDTDKHKVRETEYNRLLLFLQELQDKDVEKISIYGFCDDRGGDTYNLVLSQKRADAIKIVLTDNEIDGSIISNVDGKGEILLNVVNSEDTEVIRGLNRKVEILVFVLPKVKEIKVIEEVKPEEKKATEVLKGDLKIGDKVLLENILFETGYSNVLEESKPILNELANVLKNREDIYFKIQGHVCCTLNSRDAIDLKTKKRNLSLSRAKYIYNYLAEQGVDKKRMKYVGMRRKFPLGGDPKFDRRVEIVITYINPLKQ